MRALGILVVLMVFVSNRFVMASDEELNNQSEDQTSATDIVSTSTDSSNDSPVSSNSDAGELIVEGQANVRSPAKQAIDEIAKKANYSPQGQAVSGSETINSKVSQYKDFYKTQVENGGAPPPTDGSKKGIMSSKTTQSRLQLASAAVDIWVDSGVGYSLFATGSGDKLYEASKQAAYKSFGSVENVTKTAAGMVQSYAPTPLGLVSSTAKSIKYVGIDLKELGEGTKLALSNYLGDIHADAMEAANELGIKDKAKFDEFVTNYVNSHVNIIYKNCLLAVSIQGSVMSFVGDALVQEAEWFNNVASITSKVIGKAFEGYTLIGREIAAFIPDDSQQLGLMNAVDKRVSQFLLVKEVKLDSPVGRAVKSYIRVKAQEADLPLTDESSARVVANDAHLEYILKMMQDKEKIGLMRKAKREANE